MKSDINDFDLPSLTTDLLILKNLSNFEASVYTQFIGQFNY